MSKKPILSLKHSLIVSFVLVAFITCTENELGKDFFKESIPSDTLKPEQTEQWFELNK